MALILCPRCRTLLRESGPGASQLRCLTCGGVFVLREAIGQMAERLRSGRAEAVVSAPYRTMAVTDSEPSPPRLESDYSYRRCPFCSKHMNRAPVVERSGVVIDLCLAHGAWFDGDEIRRATDFIRELRKRTGAEEIGKETGKEIGEEIGEEERIALALDAFIREA